MCVGDARRQLGEHAAGLAIDALEHIGVEKCSTILLRFDGDKITYCIGPAKLAWDQVLVLGTVIISKGSKIAPTE